MLKHQFVTPNIKGALGRGFLLPHSQFILLKNVNFKLEATKLECPGARACETNGFENCDSKKVAENCDSSGWLGIARPALLQPPCSYKLSMRKPWWWWWRWWQIDDDDDDDDAVCCIWRGLSCGQWVSATSPECILLLKQLCILSPT